ncbi:unnamed protein product, partial [Rotaria sordida]
VWLDKNIASPECCHELKKAFTTTTNPESNLQTSINEVDINNFICDDKAQRDTSFLDVPFPFKLFDDIEPCLTYLLENAGKKRIFFITSGALGEHIVPRILNNHRKIFADNDGNIYKDSIYVFCANVAYHGQWALDYEELDCIKMENDDKAILARLTRDIANYLKSKGEEEFSNDDNSSSVELAIQYFGWAKNLYERADKVRRAYASKDPLNPLNIINTLIATAERKLPTITTKTRTWYLIPLVGHVIVSVASLGYSCPLQLIPYPSEWDDPTCIQDLPTRIDFIGATVHGSRFIYDDPKTASRRRTIELAALKRKIEARFHEKKVSPGRPVEQFIAELDKVLQNLHDIPMINQYRNTLLIQSQSSQSQVTNRPVVKKKKNYGRLVKRLKYKFRLANVTVRKSDKSKVFHLGKSEDYQKKSNEYMDRTQAYQCLDLRLAKWITQKQYEQLYIKPNEVELAHLYYLPKAHKPGTPLRPIVSGLKHPTIKISKFLDELLRPLFDKMAAKTTVNSGFELVKQLQEWSKNNMCQETLFCTIDVMDLYTMVPQIEGVLALKKMLDHLKLKQVGGLRIETIIRLSRFVMQNNYFSYDGQYYHQIRGGAMGSPLTLTVANCYMFFYEQQIIKQIDNSGGLYFRYIDDIFIVINWPARHLFKQIDRWNHFDKNIKLSENIGSTADFLDLHIENQDGQLFTTIYQKPSYEPYCSTFQAYLSERERLRMALLLNKYPNKIIKEQFNHIPSNDYRFPIKEKIPVDYGKTMFVHFTYCSSMKTFPKKFHTLWNRYFGESPINEVLPVLGTRNVKNLQRQLTYTK